MIGHWPENSVWPEFAFCRRHCQNFTCKAVEVYISEKFHCRKAFLLLDQAGNPGIHPEKSRQRKCLTNAFRIYCILCSISRRNISLGGLVELSLILRRIGIPFSQSVFSLH